MRPPPGLREPDPPRPGPPPGSRRSPPRGGSPTRDRGASSCARASASMTARPLTAEDVVFSLERATRRGLQLKDCLSSIGAGRGRRPVGGRGPHPAAPTCCCRSGSAPSSIMSRAWAEAHGVAAATPYDKDRGTYARDHAMGTGPSGSSSTSPAGRTVLVRNPDWWGAGQHPHRGRPDRLDADPGRPRARGGAAARRGRLRPGRAARRGRRDPSRRRA